MKTYTTQSGAKLPLSEAIVQKIETATINDARRWSETQGKAAFIADFLGLFSINQLVNNPDLEDQVEQRFAALLGGDGAQYRDKQIIRLSKGWTMSFAMNWDAETPYLQGFVHAPSDSDSVSLNCARFEGVTSGISGDPIEIPQIVMAAINEEQFDDFA
jgi:hypothetical protein